MQVLETSGLPCGGLAHRVSRKCVSRAGAIGDRSECFPLDKLPKSSRGKVEKLSSLLLDRCVDPETRGFLAVDV